MLEIILTSILITNLIMIFQLYQNQKVSKRETGIISALTLVLDSLKTKLNQLNEEFESIKKQG